MPWTIRRHLDGNGEPEVIAYEPKRMGGDADVRGVLAAWMADQYLLGRQDAGWATLQGISAGGEIDGDTIGPVGDAYLAKLRKFLIGLGYGQD